MTRNGLYHLFMVIWGMVYDIVLTCFNQINGLKHYKPTRARDPEEACRLKVLGLGSNVS